VGRIPPFSRPRCRPIGLTFLSFVLIASACSSSEQGVRVVRTTTTTTTEVRTGDGAIVDRATIQTGDLSGYTVFTFPGDGDDVDGQVTLDFCDARYPSEALRTARNQVAVHDDDEPRSYAIVLSMEAVMYRDAAATEQAFRELRAARLSCSVGFRTRDFRRGVAEL
jgi:hypothetical protein